MMVFKVIHIHINQRCLPASVTNRYGISLVRVWFLVVLLGLFKAKAQQASFTLHELITMAQSQSIYQKQTALAFSEAQWDLAALNASLKPQLELRAQLPNFYKSSSAITQPDGSIDFLPISQDNSELSLRLSKQLGATNTRLFTEVNLQRYENFTANSILYNSVPFRLGLEQGINAFNTIKWEKKLGKLNSEIAQRNQLLGNEKLALDVVSAFFELLLAQVSHEIATTNRDSNHKIYTIAKERFSLGILSKADLYQLELQFNKSEEELLSAKRQWLGADSQLRETVNHFPPTDTLMRVIVPEKNRAIEVNPIKAAQLAWANRPEHLENNRAITLAEMTLDQERKTRGLQLDVFASIGLIGSGTNTSSAYENATTDVVLQMGVRLPIFDGGQRRVALKKRTAQLQFAKANTAFQEQVFKQRVGQLAQQFNLIQNELGLSEKGLELAKKRYEIANQQYLLNGISITDLTLAFAERDVTWRGYIALLQSYWTLYYALRELTLYNFETSNLLYP